MNPTNNVKSIDIKSTTIFTSGIIKAHIPFSSMDNVNFCSGTDQTDVNLMGLIS